MIISLASTAILFGLAVGQNTNGNSSMPESPYDQTALFVDYGLILETYPAIAPSISDSDLKKAIHNFTLPLQQYIKAYGDEEVTAGKLKSSVIGLLDLLAGKESFDTDEISEDDWKSNQMWSAVMKRSTIEAVQQARNVLYKDIVSDDQRKDAISGYQKGMKEYRDVLMGVDRKDFKTLLTDKTIDWKLYEERYYEMIQHLTGRDSKHLAGAMRKYFAAWLRDGDQNDDAYDELVRRATAKKFLSSDASHMTVSMASFVLAAFMIALMF